MASPVLAIVPATQLTNSAAGLYTSPAGVWTQIVSLTCQNTDVTSHQVTFYLVPAAGSAGSTNVITNAQALSPKQSWNDPFVYGKVLNPGDALWGLADTGAVVNVFAAGVQTAG